MAELPGHAYNPLFIYGPPGVGKTHLLHSIGNYVLAYGAGLSVRYTTVETFTNQFLAALQRGDMDRFKGSYRHADVLLIDDVQFLASKAKTEEEFFHTFNALHDLGSQLVLTSDRLPRDLSALEDRLRERFEAGLVTAIEPPDLTHARRRPAQARPARRRRPGRRRRPARSSPPARPTASACSRARSSASSPSPRSPGARSPPPSPSEVLADLYPVRAQSERPAPLTVEAIQDITADAFGLSRDELLSHQPRRPPGLAAPGRHVPRARAHRRDPARHRRAASPGATTRPSCTPAGARPQRIAADPEAFDFVRRLTERLHPAVRGHTARRQFSPA